MAMLALLVNSTTSASILGAKIDEMVEDVSEEPDLRPHRDAQAYGPHAASARRSSPVPEPGGARCPRGSGLATSVSAAHGHGGPPTGAGGDPDAMPNSGDGQPSLEPCHSPKKIAGDPVQVATSSSSPGD